MWVCNLSMWAEFANPVAGTKKERLEDANLLAATALVIQKRFRGEGNLIEQLDYLAGQLAEGTLDDT